MFETIIGFRTKNQKFKPGDRIYRTMDLTPHSIETLVACGCIKNRLDDAAPVDPSPKAKPSK